MTYLTRARTATLPLANKGTLAITVNYYPSNPAVEGLDDDRRVVDSILAMAIESANDAVLDGLNSVIEYFMTEEQPKSSKTDFAKGDATEIDSGEVTISIAFTVPGVRVPTGVLLTYVVEILHGAALMKVWETLDFEDFQAYVNRSAPEEEPEDGEDAPEEERSLENLHVVEFRSNAGQDYSLN